MTTCVSFLRGINVGGNKKIKMSELADFNGPEITTLAARDLSSRGGGSSVAAH